MAKRLSSAISVAALAAVLTFVLSVCRARSVRKLLQVCTQTILVALAATSGSAAPSENAAARIRFVVKLKPALAEEMESVVGPAQPGNIPLSPTAKAWLAKFGLSRAEPVYGSIVRAKRERGQSYRQMTELVRQRFPQRAARRTDSFNPPEIARAYLFESDISSPAGVEERLAALRADPMVEFAQKEQAAQACFVPNDPYFSSSNSWGQAYADLYGVKAINCPGSWDVSTGTGTIVAVVDTGIDYTHLDITNNIWINPGEIPGNGIDDDGNGFVDDVRGWDFIGHNASAPRQDNDVFDRHGHGTHVAGTIAAQGNNGRGVIGVAWGARVMAVKGLDDGGSGWDSYLAQAIVYAANNGADVINASWGGKGTSPVLEDAVSYAASLGAVFVAAAGNDGADEANFFPANCSGAVSVAALDPYGNKARFSNCGNRLDVAAPGVDILSLRATNTYLGTPLAQDPSYTRADGTSMAAPHVSGAAALVLSQHPNWSSEEIRQVLRLTADEVGAAGRDITSGYGRVNALRAVQSGPTLEARILSPANESTASTTMTVAGVAQGPGFSGYVLDYGSGDDPTNWLTLATGSNAVNHSTLGTLQTSDLPDGRYTIRLRVLSLGGDTFEDRVQTTVDYDFITTPSRPPFPTAASIFKPGASIAVVGTAAGLNFRPFRVEWARGRDATSGWTNSGMALAGGGLGSVTNGLLATWNSTGITQADYYTIRLVSDRTAFTNEAKAYVYLEPDLYSTNWPQWIDTETTGSVLPARDAQGQTRLIIMNPRYSNLAFPPALWSFALDGTCHTNPLSFGSYAQLAVGNVAAATGDEVIVADDQQIKVFPANAASPMATFSSVPTSFRDTLLTLADLNGDGLPEILALGAGLFGSSNLLYAWTSTGTQVSSNFPIAVSGTEDYLRWYEGLRVMPLLNHDGRSEILVATSNTNATFTLRKYTSDGIPAAWPARTFNGQFSRMVSGDVDGDGRREIVVSYYDGTDGLMEVLSPDGTTLPGWPVRFPNGGAVVVLGDLDRDGADEIIAENIRDIYVLRGNGTPFSSAWPLHVTDLQLSDQVTIADINGDGFPEILTTCIRVHWAPGCDAPSDTALTSASRTLTANRPTGAASDARGQLRGNTVVSSLPAMQINQTQSYYSTELRAYGRDASLVRSWQLLGSNGRLPSAAMAPLVGDFDGNGKLDLAVIYWLGTGTVRWAWLDHAALTVLALDVPFIRNPHDWPMSYHDPQNSANDFAPLTISGTIRSSSGVPVSGVFVSFSNGGATTTTDRNGFYSLALDPGWTGTATPSLACCSFYPLSQSYTNLMAGKGGQDYTATALTAAYVTGTNSICSGQQTAVLAALGGQGPWTVTWSCNGAPVLTTNYSTSVGALTISPTNSSPNSVTNVVYTVSAVTDSRGCASRPQDLTGGAMITIYSPIMASISPAAATIPTNGSVTISIDLAGVAPWTLYWADLSSPQTALASPATRVVYATNIIALGTYSITFALTNVNDASPCPLEPTNDHTSEITVINTSGIVRLQNGITTINPVCAGACTNLLLTLNSWTNGNKVYGSPWTVTLSDGLGPRSVTAPTPSTNVFITECLPATTIVTVTNVVGTWHSQQSALGSNQIAGSATVLVVPLPTGSVTSAVSQTNCVGRANPPLFVAFNTGNGANWYYQTTNLVCASSATFVPTNATPGAWTYAVKEVNSNLCEATAFATNVTLVLTACPPAISLAGTNVIIQWLGDHQLLSTTNLAPPIQWTLISNPPFALATNYWTNRLDLPPPQQFFKLTNF